MKKVLKGLGIVLVGVYLVVAITLTVFLLNYNKYNITELNNKSLIIVRDEELKPDFQKGDLVIVNKDANKDIKVGDKIFFYDNYKQTVSVNLGTVLEKGQVLGIMGTTGNSSGVHLHFEVIINDQVVDPITYVNY